MPLDDQTIAVLQAFKQMGLSDAHRRLPLAEFRASTKQLGAADLTIERQGLGSVEDRCIPGPACDIPVRIYRPGNKTGPLPLLVFFHGGGYVIGDLDGYDGVCCQLTKQAGCVTVSVDYRLAPEHRFPAAFDDAEAALRWAVAHADQLGIDPQHVVVGGDSAGAHIATVVAHRMRDSGGPAIALQILVYPPADMSGRVAKRERNAEGYFLTGDAMNWFSDQFVPTQAERSHPEVSPLLAPDLSGLPRAIVITAEFDPLCDEGEHYARRLIEAGVPVSVHRYLGTIHGFFTAYPMISKGATAISEVAAAIRSLSSS